MARLKHKSIALIVVITALGMPAAFYSSEAGFGRILKPLVKKITGLPGRIAKHVARGRPADAFREVVGEAKQVFRGATGIIKDPAKLLSYASLGAQCAPTVARLSAGDASAYHAAASDFAGGGPCYRFLQQCNADLGDLFCPDVAGAREGLRSICRDTSSLRSAIDKIAHGNHAQTLATANEFCAKTDGTKMQETDEAFGRNVSSDTLQFMGHSTAGKDSLAIQAMMQASLRAQEAHQLNREQLALIREMASNQNRVIDKLIEVNREVSVVGFQQIGKISDNERERSKMFVDFATKALERVAESGEARALVERDAKRKAEELSALYRRDRDKALASLQEYMLATTLHLVRSHSCLGQLTNKRIDLAFCARFPHADECQGRVAQQPNCK
jgi:hypothetical protein